jgi:hypothetical protein
LDALQFAVQVDCLLPPGDRVGGILANPAHLQELLPGRAEDGRGVTEMVQQLAHTHRADVLDQVQGDQRFPGIHACPIPGFSPVSKRMIQEPDPTPWQLILRWLASVRKTVRIAPVNQTETRLPC